MRFGSSRGPLRATVAGMSLAGLGAAFLLPHLAVPTVSNTEVDPIITQSVDKGTAGEPTITDLPPDLDAVADDMPRQVIPASNSVDVMMQDFDQDPVVQPVMSDELGAAATGDLDNTEPLDQMAAAQTLPVERGETAADRFGTENDVGLSGTTGIGEGMGQAAVVLALDHARVMSLTGDVSTIIIGNPAIADASMPDPQTLVLTGKSYGETNMVMLNEAGTIVGEQILRVTVRGQSLVSVYRGVERTTLSCSPTCEIRPTPGDTPDTVVSGLQAFQQRNSAALEAVGQQ